MLQPIFVHITQILLMFPADPVVLVRCTVYYSRLVCMLHTLNKNQPTVGNRKQLTEYAAVQEHLK